MPIVDTLQQIVADALATAPLDAGFAKAMEAIIVKAQTAAVLAAAADRAGVTANAGLFKGLSKAERNDIKAAVKAQLGYLQGFIDAKGDMSEAAIRARMALYAGATRATYLKARHPGLSQYPGDGQTQCKTSCHCDVQEHDDGIHWVLDEAVENCDDCQAMASGGPYDAG